MARKFSALRNKMAPSARETADREFERLIEEMPLKQLRAARSLAQEQLASILHVNQSEISKIEQRTDMYLSTLASYIKAMGGQLELRAIFPRGAAVRIVRISQFEQAEDDSAQENELIDAG